jgi:hypothetical protein
MYLILHNGVVIADALRECFADWGIEDKVFTITVDNARANDSAIRLLKDDFELKKKSCLLGVNYSMCVVVHILLTCWCKQGLLKL